MKINFLAASLLALVCIASFPACDKNKNEPSPPGPDERNDSIPFTALEVGKKYHYIYLLGEDYHQSTRSFQYTDDSLELEVVSLDDKGYLINETLKYVGDIEFGPSSDKDKVFQYYLAVRNDTLWIRSVDGKNVQSRIFGLESIARGLPLRPSNERIIQFNSWEVDFFYCECRYGGYMTNFELQGQTYDRLNVAVENKNMRLDGPGETYVYSASDGIVRFTTYVPWVWKGYGWDRLPE